MYEKLLDGYNQEGTKTKDFRATFSELKLRL